MIKNDRFVILLYGYTVMIKNSKFVILDAECRVQMIKLLCKKHVSGKNIYLY